MLKIKIKVKHLVMTIAVISVAIPLLTEVVVPYSSLYVARQQAASGNIRGVQGIKDALDGSLFTEKQKWKLIRETMLDVTPDRLRPSNYDLYVGPNFTQTHHSNRTELFRTHEKIPYLDYYVGSAPIDGYWSQAVKHLAYLYTSQGQPEAAIRVLEQAELRLSPKSSGYMRKELAMKRAELIAAEGKIEEADRLLEQLTYVLPDGETYRNQEIAQLRARIWSEAGQTKQALERIGVQLAEATTQPAGDKKNAIVVQQLTRLQELLLREAERLEAGKTVVSGTVRRSDGTPLANAGVFLRHESIANRSVMEQDPYQTTTDASGHYTFNTVTPGSYQLFVGLNFDQISGWTWPIGNEEWVDISGQPNVTIPVTLYPLLELHAPVNQQTITGPEIDFEWEPVAGAAYYNVNVGIGIKNGSGSTTLKTHVKENRLRVPVEDLYDHTFGISYETVGSWSSADPSSILGLSDPDNRFFWSVDAYDADGKLLTKSSGYRLDDDSIGNLPFFYLKRRTMTEADKLVKNSRYDEALAAYKEVLESDPDNVHALRMVIRLLQSKVTVTSDESIKDAKVPYLQRMLELRPHPIYASERASYYAEKREWNEYNRTVELYDRLRQSPLNPYEQSVRGTALMKQGRFGEAKMLFEEAIKQDDSHRFVGHYIAVVLYSDHSMEEALRIAAAYPERSVGPPKRNWSKLLERVRDESASSPQYDDELYEKLEWVFGGYEDRLRSWISTTSHEGMKEFIRAIMAVR